MFFHAIRMTIACALLFSVAYPAAIWGFAQLAPGQGRGTTITANGQKMYLNIGQKFDQEQYFQGRPSAVNYDAALSGASNKGPNDPAYLSELQARVDSFRSHNPDIPAGQLPADLAMASGSGLDPHISPEAALAQISRIARIRHLAKRDLELLVKQQAEPALYGLFGPNKVHLLRLNIALDQLSATFEGSKTSE